MEYDRPRTVDPERKKDLRLFNKWVKATLIDEHVPPGCTVLDLCCGALGDLAKYQLRGVKRVIGVDISEAELGHAADRARRYTSVLEVKLLPPTDVSCAQIQERADVVACQLAIHYMFQSEERLNCMLANVSAALAPGGKFIGSTLDARELMHRAGRAVCGGLWVFGSPDYTVHLKNTLLEKINSGRPPPH